MKITWKELVKNNARTQENFSRIAVGDELQMMTPLLETMTVVSAAKALKKETSYLFLNLCMASVGIDKEKHSLGFVGPAMNHLVDKVTNALLSESLFFKKHELFQEMLLKKIVKAILILSISAGALLKSNKQEDEAKLLYTKVLLTLISSSDVLKETLKEFVSVCDDNEKWIQSSAEALTFISWILISFVSMKERKNFKMLLEIVKEPLDKALQTMDELINEVRMKSEEMATLQAFITACKMALRNENYDDFLQALEMALEATEISKKDLAQDILEIELTTVNIRNAIKMGSVEFAKRETQVSVVV